MLRALILALGIQTLLARESEGSRTNSVLLNGPWEFVLGEGTEGAEATAGQARLEWKPASLPGPFLRWNQDLANQTKFAWARRTFTVTREQAAGLAVLRWNRIGSGAAAFLNGRLVGEHEPTGPYQVIVPPGVLVAGENQIVLKIRSAGGVRKSRSGNPLIPAGFGVGMPEVTDDVWLDFADRAYMKWALALPDLAGNRVRIRVTPSGLEPLAGLRVTARVKSWPEGKVMGEGESAARLRPDPDPLGGEHFFVEVPMPGFAAWTYERRPLYVAQVTLTKEGRVLDQLTFRFGMRGIGGRNGRRRRVSLAGISHGEMRASHPRTPPMP